MYNFIPDIIDIKQIQLLFLKLKIKSIAVRTDVKNVCFSYIKYLLYAIKRF